MSGGSSKFQILRAPLHLLKVNSFRFTLAERAGISLSDSNLFEKGPSDDSLVVEEPDHVLDLWVGWGRPKPAPVLRRRGSRNIF